MPKDYAKYPFKSKRRQAVQGVVKRFLLVLILVLVISAFFYGLWVFKTENPLRAELTQWLVHAKNRLTHHQAINQPKKSVSKPAEVASNEVHFDFYTDLPNMHIKIEEPKTPTPLHPVASDKKEVVTKKTPEASYLLQIGLYKTEALANQRRVTLLLSGIEVQMVQTEQGYQLQQGPYNSIKETQKAQKILKRNDVESVILRD